MLKDMDAECKMLAQSLSPEVHRLLEASASARIFENWWQRLTGKNPNCATQASLTRLEQMHDGEHREFQEVCTLQFRRVQQLERIRSFVRLKTWAEIWLLFHVPLSFALLACLLAHIVSVFFYW
jgi:hypothetical protein